MELGATTYILIVLAVISYFVWQKSWHYRMMFIRRLIPFGGYFWYKVRNENGKSEYRPGFLYMPKYPVRRFGNPRAHIAYCTTLQNALKRGDAYTWSGSSWVKVKDSGSGGENSTSLNVCKYCLNHVDAPSVTTSLLAADVFALNYQAAPTSGGYAFNWPYLQRLFLESKNYVCDGCGNGFQHRKSFLRAVHINGDRRDNRKENLQSLCGECRSAVAKIQKMIDKAGSKKS